MKRLSLGLEPIIPARVPDLGSRVVSYGYRLRLVNGPQLTPRDPLLAAFGARITRLHGATENDEALQHAGFDPGRRVAAALEALDDDGDPVVGIWDGEGMRRAGCLSPESAAHIAAARDHGLPVHVIALDEKRTVLDDRRESLTLLVFSPSLVRVRMPATTSRGRPTRSARRRVVLLANGASELRWWDPSVSEGPAELADLPVSADLRSALQQLGDGFARQSDAEEDPSAFGALERSWGQDFLREEAARLWLRTRSELGREFAVGFLGPGMTKPSWSPDEVAQIDDEWEELS